ncbi:phosphotransferase [Pseudooceanicola sediminis]|uniref:phosphotransferase n=1 Tax=Pseudooceanicola sediminis TaxID=2211117 RepID=UPI001F1E4F07|nr:phosphotransferase [Pseudooceanicola sediminis]
MQQTGNSGPPQRAQAPGAGGPDAATDLARLGLARGLARDPALWQPQTGGRSNLSWRVPHPNGDCVVKLFRPARGCTVFPNDPAAEAQMLRHLSGCDIAPTLLHAGDTPQGPCIVYRHIAGPTWAGGRAEIPRIARLLRHLHGLPAPSGLRRGPNGTDALRDEIAAQLPPGAHCPPLPDVTLPPVAPRLIHGDPVPGNIVISASGLRLIDWQCPALGDPCLDLATFLSPAMGLLYLGKPLDSAARADFLAAYGDAQVVARYHALAPFFHARMAAYCLSRAASGSAADRRAATLELAALA